ncbi:MAG: wobble nucleotide-excising tRNase [Halioglobus sp.]|jgi:wobble nucleotide-excising tRNase
MEVLKQNKSLKEIFENIESVREDVNSKGSFISLIKQEGGHVYSDGLFERLDDNFSSTSKEYPGMSMFH